MDGRMQRRRDEICTKEIIEIIVPCRCLGFGNWKVENGYYNQHNDNEYTERTPYF